MNSFFASCEQQVNYYLRGRPVGVCVYTGQYGCVISPSVEAKQHGVKTGMRLNDAMVICPELVPLETNPQRYREFHVKIMKVLKKYSDDVVPKSIDEAIVHLTEYKLLYKDIDALTKNIKQDIYKEVGEWMRCSIGVAPNSFLAKLASGLKKPDGYVRIYPETIDTVLGNLKLTDLPGISGGMAKKFEKHNILSPVQIKYTDAATLRRVCGGIVGDFWHRKLNGLEVDAEIQDYKAIGVMRQLSKEQRASRESLDNLLTTLCSTLERRLVQRDKFCKDMAFGLKYEDGYKWGHIIRTGRPLQDGVQMKHLIINTIEAFCEMHNLPYLLNENVTRISINVLNFSEQQLFQHELFGDNNKRDRLRKTVYGIKEKQGKDSIMKAEEMMDEVIYKDIIGFGSIKDLYY